ncbi:hypothetical protein Tco_0861345 [Tanacetum coccineum]|uniref:Reverse transcriptase domain-containing protein n=1 Tax=Tanacetum coccineum TaxID=301880 RepID=A0ABQ5BIC0_9ASTR
MGKIELSVMFGSEGLCRRTMMKFTVVRASSPYNIILGRTARRKASDPREKADKEILKSKKEPVKEEVLVNLAFSEQRITIGTQFSPACRLQLINLLKDNKDVFAWQPSDMVGVPRRIIQHSLNVSLSITLVAQKRRVLGPEKSKAVTKEVEE